MTSPALFISWSVQHGRSRDLAAAFGAEAIFIGVRHRRRRWLTPARYVVCAVVTVRILLTRRPPAIFVMTPPLPLAVIALVYSRIARVPVALDAHTGAVLGMRTGRPRKSLQILARFATRTIVTNSELADQLKALGPRCVILHDPAAPTREAREGDASPAPEFVVVAPLSWAPDEPIDQIIEAAGRCPDLRFVATGRAPAAVRERRDLPSNLALVGFLDDVEFGSLIAGAGVILALTTREATMQQAGYEAMALSRPVIASDTRVLREFFGDAALYAGTSEELATAVMTARSCPADLQAAMAKRRLSVNAEFHRSVAEIAAAMGLRLPADADG